MFMVLVGAFALFIVTAAIGLTMVAMKGEKLDSESKAFVDRIVPIICADLNVETLTKYASEEMLNSVTREKFDALFRLFRKLGGYTKFNGSSGEASMLFTLEDGKLITAEYVADVEFETGPAKVKVMAVRRGEGWKLMEFMISSPALLQ